MAGLSLRVVFGDDAKIGPGKVALLEEVEAKGSIRAAAAAMGMSYRQAWLLIHNLETTFGGPVLDKTTGGKRGGGAKLNKLGHAIVTHYRAMERDAAKATARDFRALQRLVKRDA